MRKWTCVLVSIKGKILEDFIESRPQELCLMCGRCCRVATTPKLHKDLVKLAEDGDESAKEFLTLFEPYSSIEDARKVDAKIVDNILKVIESAGEDINKVTFYRCKYIMDNNLCGRYKDRLDICKRFPSTMYAVVPPGCGFEGWLFQKKEEIKKKVRQYKEIRLELEVGLKMSQDVEIIKRNEEAIRKIDNIIERYAKYGAKDW